MSVIDNTASILTRRRRFSRTMQDVYYLPIMISDGGIPSLSSSSTLTIRVCACERDGRVRTCHAEAFLSSAGLSTGALIAILLCVVILLGKWLQFWWVFVNSVKELKSKECIHGYAGKTSQIFSWWTFTMLMLGILWYGI